MESSKNVESSDEIKTDSLLKKKKKEKKLEDSNFSSILESDLQPPKTPKPKEKSSYVAAKTPKTPKTPKENFELPANFKVIEHKTEKKSWKTYQDHDGKKFRSMTEVMKYLENTSNLVDTKELT